LTTKKEQFLKTNINYGRSRKIKFLKTKQLHYAGVAKK
jgi:hypothetical protein